MSKSYRFNDFLIRKITGKSTRPEFASIKTADLAGISDILAAAGNSSSAKTEIGEKIKIADKIKAKILFFIKTQPFCNNLMQKGTKKEKVNSDLENFIR